MFDRLPYVTLVALMTLFGCVACAQPRTPPYQNNHMPFEPKGLGALAKWKLEAARDGLPPKPKTATPPRCCSSAG